MTPHSSETTVDNCQICPLEYSLEYWTIVLSFALAFSKGASARRDPLSPLGLWRLPRPREGAGGVLDRSSQRVFGRRYPTQVSITRNAASCDPRILTGRGPLPGFTLPSPGFTLPCSTETGTPGNSQ
eukprot:5712808-Pyramimonas_sp.AAC.1